MHYSITSKTAPEMPALGRGLECIKTISSQLSNNMRQAIIPMLFAPLGTYLTKTEFKYPDNTYMEACGIMTCLCGISGIGKKEFSNCVKHIMHRLSKHDDEETRKYLLWQKANKSKGANQRKEEEPEVFYRYPPSNTTGPALTKNAMACEKAGKKCQFFNMSEIEMANNLCGGHRQVSEKLRNIFDMERVGALRATADGVTGNPTLRVNICFSTTPIEAQNFFRKDLYNGTFGRIMFSYKIQEMRSGVIPVQGPYNENFLKELNSYIDLLEECQGRFIIEPLNKLIRKLALDMADSANLFDDDTFHSLSKRSLIFGFKCGCILYILNHRKWTASMGKLVEWLIYNELWSKYQIFAEMLSKGDNSFVDVLKSGPKNMLDDLPNSFNEAQLEALRAQLGKPNDAKGQIKIWKHRGFIEFSAQTGLYTKTRKYLSR